MLNKAYLYIGCLLILACTSQPKVYHEKLISKVEAYTSDYSHLAIVKFYDIVNVNGCRVNIEIYLSSDQFVDTVRDMYLSGELEKYQNYHFLSDNFSFDISYFANLFRINVIEENNRCLDQNSPFLRVSWNRNWYDGKFTSPDELDEYETYLIVEGDAINYNLHIDGDDLRIEKRTYD